jgi:hypothetical protein
MATLDKTLSDSTSSSIQNQTSFGEYDLSSYNPNKWKDCGKYWLYDTDQRDPDWLLVRLGRPSGSSCGSLIGHSIFSTPDETAATIAGVKKKDFTPQQIEVMDHGTKMEPFARDWYTSTNKVEVEELGFVIPKFDPEIGVSVDGDVIGTDGMIEIKAPKKMYNPLKSYMAKQSFGIIPSGVGRNSMPLEFSHIWQTHYDQMQLGMAILDKKWCDYIVYCADENCVFNQRIPFNESYWRNVMYPAIRSAIDHKIKPYLAGSVIPLMPIKDGSY